MKVSFVLNQPFPHALACSKRIHLYAKGMAEQSNSVEIFIPRSTESYVVKNFNTVGEFDGVKFRYVTKGTRRSKAFVSRRISDIISPLKLGLLLLKEKPDVIFIISMSFYHILVFKIVSLISKAKYVKERNEIPFMHRDSLSFFHLLYLKMENILYDAIVFITRELELFYKKELNYTKSSCIIPVIANFDQNKFYHEFNSLNNKLVYTGNMEQRKDGILTIVEAFGRVLQYYQNLELFITGGIKKNENYYKLISKIKELGIENHVVFTGYLSEEKLKELQEKADILLLAKPPNRQNKYNFPTKVGEYLAAGKPILISEVGEIVRYFKDGENIFIAKSDVTDFYKKIKFILDHYNESCKIARKGLEHAQKEFNYKTCSIKLNDFLLKL